MLKAGDLALYNQQTLHCGSANESRDKVRRQFYISMKNPLAQSKLCASLRPAFRNKLTLGAMKDCPDRSLDPRGWPRSHPLRLLCTGRARCAERQEDACRRGGRTRLVRQARRGGRARGTGHGRCRPDSFWRRGQPAGVRIRNHMRLPRAAASATASPHVNVCIRQPANISFSPPLHTGVPLWRLEAPPTQGKRKKENRQTQTTVLHLST